MTVTPETGRPATEHLAGTELGGPEHYRQTALSIAKLINLAELVNIPPADRNLSSAMRNPDFYTAVDVTRLHDWSHPDDNVRVFEKMDQEQPTGSFKVRGAFLACYEALRANSNTRVFTAFSAGNHGAGVAHFVQWFNRRQVALGEVRCDQNGDVLAEDRPRLAEAHIFCKASASEVKKNMLRKHGAIVHDNKKHTTLEEAATAARDFTASRNRNKEASAAVLIPPYDHPDVRAGQSTALIESIMQLWAQGVDTTEQPMLVYAAVGGGGKALGSAVALAEMVRLGLVHQDSQIVAAQMENADSLSRGLHHYQAGQIRLTDLFLDESGHNTFETSADGIAVESPSLAHIQLADELVWGGCLRFLTVTMAEIGQEKIVAESHGMIKEPAGALAGAAQRKDLVSALNLEALQVIITSGGNETIETAQKFHRAAVAGALALTPNSLSGPTATWRNGMPAARA